MTETPFLFARLRRTADRISQWRAEADTLRATIGLNGRDEAQLLHMEETCAAIAQEITDFEKTRADLDQRSHAAAGELADVGDALRLVLMEITEMSTAACALDPLPEPSLRAAPG